MSISIGGDGGNPWDDGFNDEVKTIVLQYGECINSIHIEYEKDGRSFWGEIHGGSGPNEAKIELNPGEYLNAVSGYKGPINGSPTVVTLLNFTGMKNGDTKNHGPYGVKKGTPFLPPADGGKIVGFTGSSDDKYLISLGIHVKRA